MSGIRAGNIYYTVGIDKASLAALKKEIKGLGDEAGGAGKGVGGLHPELAKLAAKASDVSNRMSTLNKDFKGNRRESQEYKDGMRALGVEAGRLRDEIAALGPEVIKNDGAMASASAATSKLAGVMTQAAKVTGHMGSSTEMLGNEVIELQRFIDATNIEIRTLADELSVGAITTKEFTVAMQQLDGNLAAAKLRFDQMNTATDKADASAEQLRATKRKLSIATRLSSTETAKATGKINQMAMAQKLSYGATTLLNDRIFQLSPALGILTNQLIFTTNGFKAFLTAALPIVAVAGTLIGLFTTMVVSLKSAVGLEAALADVRKTTNLASEELKEITQTFQDLSKEIPITVMELLDIAKVAGQLGIVGAKNIEKFSETVAKLAIATDVVGEEGATSLARFLQATGTAMDDMGTEAERVANVLNQLENTSAATAAEILQMTSYTQGLASQAGLTTDEILAINAALLSLGVKAEAGGSAVVRTMSKIQVAASTGGAQLERFAENANMTTEEFRVLVKESPIQALEALAQGMKETADNGGDLNDVLIEMGINEVRERRALLALAQGADTLSSSMESARRESFEMASLSAEVAIQADTVKSKFTLLGNRFVETGQDIGMFLLPALHAVLDVLIALTDNMDGIVSVAGALSVALGVRGLSWAFLNAATGAGTLLAILRAFMGPVGLITAGVGLLTAGWQLWAKSQEDASTATEEAAEDIEELEAKLDSAAAVFARVRSKNDLVYAMEAVSKYLDGDASSAWDDYKAKVFENIDTVEDLKVAITEAMQALVAIEAQAERSALRASEAAIREYIASSDVLSKVFGAGPLNLGDPAAFRAQLESALSGFRTGNTSRIPMFEDGDLAPYEIEELARGVGVLIGLTEDLEGNQLRYNAAVADGAESVAFLQSLLSPTDTAPPPGGTPPDGTGGRSPLEEIMRNYREESNFLIAMMEDQGSTIEAQRAQAEGALENAQRTKEALYRLLSSEDLDPTLVSGIFDAISDMNQVISNLGVVDPLADAVAWTERLVAEVRFGYKTAQEAADLISPRLEQLDEQAAAALDEFGVDSVQYQDALNKIDVLKAALEEIGEIEPPAWVDPQADRRSMDQERRRAEQFAVTGPTLAEMHEILGRDDYLKGLIAEYNERQRINDLLRESAMLSDQERRAAQGAAIAARVEQEQSLARAQLGMQEDRRRMATSRRFAEYAQEQADAERMAQAESRTRSTEMDAEAARRGSLAQSMVQNYQDEQDAIQRLEDIATNYASTLEDIGGMQSHGLITNLEAIEMQARAAEERMLALAAETGWASSETTAAVVAYNELREELSAATETWGKYGDGIAYTVSAIEQTEGPFNSVGEAILAIGEYIPVTAEMVDYLNERFGETEGSVGSAEEAISDYADKIKELGALFAFGIIDQAEYVQGTIDALKTKFKVLAITASATEEELAALAKQIESLEVLLGELTAKGDFEEFLQTDGVKIGLSALQEASALLPGFQSKGNEIFGAFVGVASTVADTLVPGLGQVVSIIGDAINKVLDLSNGMEEVANAIDEAANSSKYVSDAVVEGFMDIEGMVYREKRGGFLGWLGVTKAAINEEFLELAMGAANAFADGFAGALRDGIKAAMDGEQGWKKVFRDSFHEAIINAVLDTFIQTVMLTTGLQDTIAEFSRIMVEEGPAAAFAYLNGELPNIYAEAEYWINEAANLVPDAFKKGEESSEETLERIKKNLIEQGGVLSENLVGTLIRLATTDGLIDEAALNVMVSIAKSIADGFESGLRGGINAFLEGKQDWKEQLAEGIKSTIVSALIDAFIASSAVNAVAADFVEGFLAAFKDPNVDAAQWAADNIGNALGQMSGMIEDFVSSIPRELLPSSNPRSTAYRPPEPPARREPPTKTKRAAGTNISEITGPTRDLLIDLLTPLSIMPSWTSMIRDIRNDVRAMASGSGFSGMGVIQAAPIMGAAQTNINIQNLTVSTQARDARSLFRELSEFAYNERRGGK